MLTYYNAAVLQQAAAAALTWTECYNSDMVNIISLDYKWNLIHIASVNSSKDRFDAVEQLAHLMLSSFNKWSL